MLSLLTRCRLEGTLDIIENTETVQSAALKVPVIIEGHTDDLIVSFHLLNDLEVCAVKYLDVSFVESDKDEAIIADRVENFKLARHLLLQFELIGTEEVQLHLLVLAQNRVDADKLDELRGSVQDEFI